LNDAERYSSIYVDDLSYKGFGGTIADNHITEVSVVFYNNEINQLLLSAKTQMTIKSLPQCR